MLNGVSLEILVTNSLKLFSLISSIFFLTFASMILAYRKFSNVGLVLHKFNAILH